MPPESNPTELAFIVVEYNCKPSPLAEFICNFAIGAVVPMPTLPFPNMVMILAPFILKFIARLLPSPAGNPKFRVGVEPMRVLVFAMAGIEFETVSSSVSVGTLDLRWSSDAGLVVPMPTLPPP